MGAMKNLSITLAELNLAHAKLQNAVLDEDWDEVANAALSARRRLDDIHAALTRHADTEAQAEDGRPERKLVPFAATHKFEVGDEAVVMVEGSHCFPVGQRVQLHHITDDGAMRWTDGSQLWYVSRAQLGHYAEAEHPLLAEDDCKECDAISGPPTTPYTARLLFGDDTMEDVANVVGIELYDASDPDNPEAPILGWGDNPESEGGEKRSYYTDREGAVHLHDTREARRPAGTWG